MDIILFLPQVLYEMTLPNKARNKCSRKTVSGAPRVGSAACAEPNTTLYTIPTIRNTQYATYFYTFRQKDVATGSMENGSASHSKLHSVSNLGDHILT